MRRMGTDHPFLICRIRATRWEFIFLKRAHEPFLIALAPLSDTLSIETSRRVLLFELRRVLVRLHGDVMGLEGRAGGALKIGYSFVQIGLRLDLAAARRDQLLLALQDQKDRRQPRLKLALFALVLLLGGVARSARRSQPRLRRAHRL